MSKTNGHRVTLFLVPVAMACVASTASAWQFRDLDKPGPSTSKEVTETADTGTESLNLISLVPTTESFTQPVAPIVNSPRVEGFELNQPQVAMRPAPIDLAPTPDPNAEPLGDPEPIKKPTSPVIKPTPVSDKELAVADGPELKAPPKKRSSLQVFKDGMSPEGPRAGIYAAKFNNVSVGETKEDDLLTSWGEPVRTLKTDDAKTLIYQISSFRQVDVTIQAAKVSSILVHLDQPQKAEEVEEKLSIGEFRSVLIPDEYGEVLGQAYPERGLLFSFVDDTDPDDLLVNAILIEPISAEMFRLRAQYDFQHNYREGLADLEEAIRIDPLEDEAYWLRAEYLDACGKTREAVKAAQKAIRLKPASPVYRLTRARLFAKTNRLKQGIEEVESVINEIDLRDDVAGRAHNLLGDLLAIGPDADHQKALKEHLKAIDYASRPVDDRRFGIRRLAKHTLVSAHMSVARDIALGNFQRQSEVVPKWLLRATDLADEFIADDQGDEMLQMEIFRDTLASYAELQEGQFEAAIATEEAVTTGRDIITKATDDLYKTQVERLLAETLLHAAKIHRTRGKHVSALQFATTGLALLDNSQGDWEETSHDHYLEAQLQFVVGSIHAVKDSNHEEAIDWYKKARGRFVGSNFASPLYSDRNHGEMYVSMGLSFWSTGDKSKGIRLTQTGAELMKDAVEAGSLRLDAMAVPYGNLATMHSKLGNNEKSQQYAKLVAKVDELTSKTR